MKEKFLIACILLFSLLLRIYGINWDQNQHLHPDERFLTMVGTAEKIPSSIFQYFNPLTSLMNPYNLNYTFFVYGTFPLTLNKLFVTLLQKDNYNDFTFYGRLLSASFDVLTLLTIYKICQLWERKKFFSGKVKYWAVFFYGIAVLPIQLSHFFAVEPFLNFFMTTAFYFVLKYYYQPKTASVFFYAIFFGLALGTKITALFITPLIFCFFIIPLIKQKKWLLIIKHGFVFIIASYVTLRIADPKFFASGNFFNPLINPQFINNLKELNTMGSKDSWYPPAIQWMNKKPVLFSLGNIAFYGLGLPYFILMVWGIFLFLKKHRLEFYLLFFWILGFFLYQSSQFSQTMRYFILIYPFFAVFAALAFLSLSTIKNLTYRRIVMTAVLLTLLVWPAAFMHIYSRNHSRVTASEWIYQNIPANSLLAEEHWDDALPVGLPDRLNRTYQIVQMPVFGPDNEEKWQQIDDTLAKANYYITTSNRAYGSIMTVPVMYPRMASFYQRLLTGKTDFKLIKEFTSYPTIDLGLLKWAFNDDNSEEAFTVYDHPKVMIFKRK